MSGEENDALNHGEQNDRRQLSTMALAALGVVFGDIGTSPLYALKASLEVSSPTSIPVADHLYGLLSLVFWALALVITVKYALVILRADDDGEGGVLALLAQIHHKATSSKIGLSALGIVGIVGAALLFGDGVITPAISVVSAVEGLAHLAPDFSHFVVPSAIVILGLLFFLQKYGVSGVGPYFGPTMLVWFVSLALLGIWGITEYPKILLAINPYWAIKMGMVDPGNTFWLLGFVVLCVTGAEALFADLGHFNRQSISLSWYYVVWPSLLLNYFGQGGYMIAHADQIQNRSFSPFFALVPDPLMIPMILLATLAAIIASQAMITGAFSLTRQASQMGFFPLVPIVHTSSEVEGRIYIPPVNLLLFCGCALALLIFPSSTDLAGAYGIAVTAVMVTTSILFAAVARQIWNWPLWKLCPVISLFLTLDLAFFAANVIKIDGGGWFPMVIAGILVWIMTTWQRGNRLINERMTSQTQRLEDFVSQCREQPQNRMVGQAVFPTADSLYVPFSLATLCQHVPVVYETVVVLSMIPEESARVPRSKQLCIKELGQGVWVVTGRYGFLQVPNIPRILTLAANHGVPVDPQKVTYFISNQTIDTKGPYPMWEPQKVLYVWLQRNAYRMTSYFQIPPKQVMEIGMRFRI